MEPVDHGKALSDGDTETIADCWDVPALVLSEQGALAVNDLADVRRFFGKASQQYRDKGLRSTTPELLKIEAVSAQVDDVDVRWTVLDAEGKVKASERARYILRRDDKGAPKISVAIAAGD